MCELYIADANYLACSVELTDILRNINFLPGQSIVDNFHVRVSPKKFIGQVSLREQNRVFPSPEDD